jgi:hypothetical protein
MVVLDPSSRRFSSISGNILLCAQEEYQTKHSSFQASKAYTVKDQRRTEKLLSTA